MTKEIAWNKIVGNEHIKRAMEVALAGNHSLTVIGNPENGEKYIKVVLPKSIFLSPCPCENFGDILRQCTCSVSKLSKYRESKKYRNGMKSDIIIEIVTPRAKEYEYPGEDFVKVKERISKRFISIAYVIDKDAQTLLNTAIEKFGFTMYAVNQIVSVANTIVSLDNYLSTIQPCHMAEAMQYKLIDRR